MSDDPLTISPFGNVANALTQPVWPFKVRFNVPSFGFHILTVFSDDPLTKSPVGNVVNAETKLFCPYNVWFTKYSVRLLFEAFFIVVGETCFVVVVVVLVEVT